MGPDGKQSLRVRRGLGTRDETEAAALVDQLNEILADQSYWNPAAQERAAARYEQRIVAAFYDYIQADKYDPWADREGIIPLPGADQGYPVVQFVGTTGSGKTTAVRQILGTDPVIERFPSTSAAKTTVCDIELVLQDGSFRAAVSFLQKDQVRQLVSDCVAAAVISCLEGNGEPEVVRRFLEHSEQRFRLSYLLGTPNVADSVDDDLCDDVDAGESESDSVEVDDDERRRLSDRLQDYIKGIRALADRVAREVEAALGESMAAASGKDRDAFEELVESELLSHDEFHALVDWVLEDVESRFELLKDGEFTLGRDNWPTVWSFESTDRAAFLKIVNRFSSNYAPNFGRLLTPLVQGLRVAGPFRPAWCDGEVPRLVLLDGQGIGHTADSTSSISTGITRRFQLADLILLVDNAAQPMQAAACAVLRSLVASGHESKLVLGFTHFDEVKGDNLVSGMDARKNHVLASFDNAVHAIGKAHGRDAENALKRLSPDRVVFFSNIQLPLTPKNQLTQRGFERVFELARLAIVPPGPVEFTPVYDVANLVLAVQKATQEFHDRWKGILSMGSRSGVSPEHWTRVKALTRRIGVLGLDEYDTLRPVADLIRILQNQVSGYVATPMEWKPQTPGEQEEEQRIQVLDGIRTEVFSRLHDLSNRRLINERLSGWVEAYNHRGTGSTWVRAKDLVSIYESAAPVPNEMPGPDANEFLFELRELVREAIVAGGGDVRGWRRDEASVS
jgi:hypothetical protein